MNHDITIQDVFHRFLPQYCETHNFSPQQQLTGLCISKCHTLEMGAKSECFVAVYNREELLAATSWAKETGLPIFVLGGGFNILFTKKIIFLLDLVQELVVEKNMHRTLMLKRKPMTFCIKLNIKGEIELYLIIQ